MQWEAKYLSHPFCILATTMTAILTTGAGVAYFKELFMHLPIGTGNQCYFGLDSKLADHT
jgi:hypothetical protein